MRITTFTRWKGFKRHAANFKDEFLLVRSSKFIETESALSDLFAHNLMYHFPC